MAVMLPGRIMALDIGEKWLGIALSDPLRLIASPLSACRCENDEDIIDTVKQAAVDNAVTLVVAGVPRSLSGEMGPQAQKTNSIIEKLRSSLNVPVITHEERFSTSRARDILAGKKLKKPVRDDAVAAAVILEDYLETAAGDDRPPSPAD